MRWQDIVIALCQIGFIFALWPSVRSRHKPALYTSLGYVVLICAISFCLLTLHLWLSAATAFAGAVEWLILLIQKRRIDKATK